MTDRVYDLRVWDFATRATHWAIAVLFGFSWWSAETDHLPWHRISGDLIFGLLLFRVAWGLYGSQTAKFTSFVKGPEAVLAYVRGARTESPGHNPLGALSVVALLLGLTTQVALGLFSVDEDGLEPGPLSRFIDFDLGRKFAKIHHLAFNALLGLVALHLFAIAVYEFRRKRLIWPMLTGRARVAGDLSGPSFAAPWLAWLTLAVAGGVAWLVAHGLRLTGPV
ncbi:MAG: cytochrome b/b6 domain-containing protein [Proteobacteria bacterium]|nr:cytochrome b/b6 domain-containing protein [Pseudomonadota bacterium]